MENPPSPIGDSNNIATSTVPDTVTNTNIEEPEVSMIEKDVFVAPKQAIPEEHLEKKRLKKLLKAQEWLQSSGYSLVVIVDPIQQLSFRPNRDGSPSEPPLQDRQDEDSDIVPTWTHRQDPGTEYSNDDAGGSSNSTLDPPDFDAQPPPLAITMPIVETGGRVSGIKPPEPFSNSSAYIEEQPSPACESSLGVYIHPDSLKRSTICGMPAFGPVIGPERSCFTIGGIVLIDDSVYGLAAGHPFDHPLRGHYLRTEEQEHARENNLGVPPPVLDSVSDDDSDADSESASPWVWFGDDIALEVSSRLSQSRNAVSSSSSPLQLACSQPQLDPPSAGIIHSEDVSIGAIDISGTSLSGQGRKKAILDWALIRLDGSQHWNANEVTLGDSSSPEQIIDVADIAHLGDGNVTVVAGFTGVSSGRLRQSPTMLRLGSRCYEVHEIVLENALVRGDSGAWVVRGGMLCGHVIAQRSLSPIAYMLPAYKIFEDIREYLGTTNVKLPDGPVKTGPDMTRSNATDASDQVQEVLSPTDAHRLQPSQANRRSDTSGPLLGGIQVIELYSACRCLYHAHAVDRTPHYGRPGAHVRQKTILVGYACPAHSTQG
ncbi:hypothetical protein PG991_014835 [Apiospora marii]|uniref:Uncharacterized protein n=1 Tax=Apiospora marii TaxID=335849 RepID=A0ABR1R4P2_9PEZI